MTPERPPLSIVIPSHSRADLLELCLQSVLHCAPHGTQIIVVDDGSKKERITDCAAQFANVEIIRHARPRGFCVAANAGIAVARAGIVELLNDDTEVTEGWAVAAMSHFFESRVAAVAPLVLQDRNGDIQIDSAGDDYNPGGFAAKRFHQSPLRALHACEVRSVSGCAGFYCRSALLEAGGFPEQFGAYFDDVDLSQRLRRRGYELRFEPESRVWHHGGASYGSPTRRLIEQQSRNEEWLYWRNRVAGTLPHHVAVLAGKALRRLEEGMLGPWLAGRLRALTSYGFAFKS